MNIEGELVLPRDVQIVPVLELPPELRARIDATDEDFTVTRRRSRIPSNIVDRDGAELLANFRKPTRIVDAVLAYAGQRGLNPRSILEAAFPLLSRLVRARLLVAAESRQAKPIEAELELGSVVSGFRLIRCVRVLDDNEVFVARDEAGRFAAVKFYRSPGPQAMRALEREAANLDRVGKGRAPRVYGLVQAGSGLALVAEWVLGDDALAAAAALHGRRESRSEERLLALCVRVAEAFADVHEAGLLHGDVHPGNVVVERSGSVRLIDFGFARAIQDVNAQDVRGVPFYFDPEYAQAMRGNRSVACSCAAEQYSVAALLYQLWTGVHYLDWRLDRDQMLRQIAEEEPVALPSRGVAPWPALEKVLRRALSKSAGRRYPDVRSLSKALSALAPEAEARDRRAEAVDHGRNRGADWVERALARYDVGGEASASGLCKAPRASINYGAGGIAYALLRISQRRGDPHLLAMADLWSQKAYALATREGAFYNAEFGIEPASVGEISLFHSPAGLHCVRALVSAAQGDTGSRHRAVQAFIEHAGRANPGLDRGAALDAVLGEGSLLLGCAELIEAVPDSSVGERSAIHARAETLARDIREMFESGAIDSSEALRTLGIAHGWAGLLFVLLRWARASGRSPVAAVRTGLDRLAMLSEPRGAGLHWPVDCSGSTFRDGWCNGPAGFVMLYALAHEMLREPRYGEIAERAAISAWNSEIDHGTLCCGQAGIGYALLAAHRVTGTNHWLRRARVCARIAAADRSMPYLQDALYKGGLGAVMLAEDLKDPARAGMPLFEPMR